ncbi:MAG TPA: hypothetical protein VJK52_03495 [Candidatus Nanoarchaeia archaeon]|nr:hypothetical protein [Candidatus Nanoarchaeia archaeon]
MLDTGGELSTNALALLLLIAISVSAGGMILSLGKLRGTALEPITGFATSTTGTASATVINTTAISLVISNVSFSLAQSQMDNTTDDSPGPFNVQNDGNVPVNVTINASALFISTNRNRSSFRFMCRQNEGNCQSGSASSYTDMPTANDTLLNRTVIFDLPFQDFNDSRYVDILVNVPADEPGGLRTSTVTFTAAQI